MRLLIVEDDRHTREFVERALREAGHTVDAVGDGRQGLILATSEPFELLILDRMLPNVDGLTIVRTLRASNIDTPVLILSALGDVDDRVAGLRAGGDDYLVKPFALSELLARIDVLGRRPRGAAAASSEPMHLRVADIELDRLKRTVRRGARKIDLQPKEFQLLEYLMRHSGQVITRTMLLEGVWDYHFDPKTNVIDVHISNLRGKVDHAGEPPLIHTVRGVGYRFGIDAA